ncbi:unnamed protein product [Lupinus luteus]|uniref:Uncharacterized protein n=1 Tax=Lupinus luteus TaxID=3873 RepID=A0AAV1W3A5_LUPLU
MKLSSMSMFSTCHISREPPPPPQMSLSSSSFNKRLVTNSQASPMSTTVSVGSKRGSGFDKPEPSSPKVTCIGQVRVKAKKRGAISKSKRRSSGDGEARFRIAEVGVNQNLHQQQRQQDRNQRWVHLPLTICEALKELSCMFPCTREKEEKVEDAGRWKVTMQEGKREIELVMREEEEEEEEDRTRHRRRHVFEDIDLDDIEKVKNKKEEEEVEERGSVSICIPPKNALLLMRCRSDPVKVAALTNRFLQPSFEEVPMEEDKEVHEGENGIDRVDTKKEDVINQMETNEVVEAIEEEEKKAGEDANGNEQVEIISENDVKGEEEEQGKGSKERENKSNIERGSGSLPECLLMMMCEPKLSIEVSKETWVCTADFVRWLPPRPAVKTDGGDRQAKKRVAVESKPPLEPPPRPVIKPGRSSCSFPAQVVVPNVCESDVLKRCKSEPRETAAAKLAPESCLWNSRKLMEPYASAQLGIGTAGVGY